MKQALSLIITIFLVALMATPAFAAEEHPISPYYVNATTVDAALTINSNGTAKVVLTCAGDSDVTNIISSAYLEFYNGSTWERVDIDTPSNTWIYSTSSSRLYKTYTITVPTRGDYRVVATFAITASTTETVNSTGTCSY